MTAVSASAVNTGAVNTSSASTSAPVMLSMSAAINAGLRRAMTDDEKVVLLGEDIGHLGGVYRVTDGLQTQFGERRVIDTPLAESGILGTAIGLAYRGYRPVCEIQFDGFIYPAFDQIVSQLSRMHSRTLGAVRMPIVIRIPWAGGIGAAEHHSDSPEALFTHTAGLRVVAVSNPQDAYDMIREAIASDDPVLYFEPKRRYHGRGPVDLERGDLGRGDLERGDLGRASAAGRQMDHGVVVETGDQVTLVAYGGLVQTARDAAAAAREEGMSIEVIDLRSLSPVDYDLIEASVRKTGRLVVTHEASREGGLGAEIVATVTERCFEFLEAAPERVTGHDIPYPPAKLEKHHLPDLDRILDAVDRVLGRPNSRSGEESGSGSGSESGGAR